MTLPKLSIAAKLYVIFALMAATTLALSVAAVHNARSHAALTDEFESANNGSLNVERVNGLLYAMVEEVRDTAAANDADAAATHAHELIELNERIGGALSNWQVSVRKRDLVANLEEERSVAVIAAALHAPGAADAQLLVDRELVEGVLDVGAMDRARGAKLVLGGRGPLVGLELEEARAEVAIAAHGKGVDALDGRLFQHAGRRALAALHALVRVELPEEALPQGLSRGDRDHAAQRRRAADAQANQGRRQAAQGRERGFHGSGRVSENLSGRSGRDGRRWLRRGRAGRG